MRRVHCLQALFIVQLGNRLPSGLIAKGRGEGGGEEGRGRGIVGEKGG